MTRRLLFLIRHQPGPTSRETLDVALVGGVFDQHVSMLFREDGVQLLANQDTLFQEIDEAVRSLPDYGIEAVYVCEDGLKKTGLKPEQLIVPVIVITADEQRQLLASQDMVLID